MGKPLRVHKEEEPMHFGELMPIADLVLASSQRTDTYTRPITEEERNSFNPACRNGGYRSNNNPDPKYQTDANGRFVKSKCKRSSHGG